MAGPHLPEVTFVPVRDGSAWRGEVIDVHSQQRLARTATTYAHASNATSAATSLWRTRQRALLSQLGHAPQAVMA